MRMIIYILNNAEKRGPYTLEEVIGLIQRGENSLSNLAWREGMKGWQPLHSLTDIVEAVLPPIPSSLQNHDTKAGPPPIPNQTDVETKPPLESPQILSQPTPMPPAIIQATPALETSPETKNQQQCQSESNKRILPAFFLSLLLGVIGAHSFYAGRTVEGLILLILFILGVILSSLAGGIVSSLIFLFIFVCWLAAIFRTALGLYKDGQGRKITKWA